MKVVIIGVGYMIQMEHSHLVLDAVRAHLAQRLIVIIFIILWECMSLYIVSQKIYSL